MTTHILAERLNGFDLGDDALIPVADIHSGGPGRDGIPSIDKPRFVAATSTGEVRPDDPILGLEMAGVAKAYPIAVMNWHEIVNDRFDSRPVVVTYCPLCGSGVAYTARVSGMELTFGVSGLLYNSDVLLYDRQTDSLWSQMLSKAISGPMKGTRLTMLPLTHTTWSHWLEGHPDSLLLSRKSGFKRNYDKDPYAGYEDEKGVWFPVQKKDPRFHPKERVVGLELDGRFKAYPLSELSQTKGEVNDRFAGQVLSVEFDPGSQSASIRRADGKVIPTINSFWFAWYAFHPETEVYRAP
jgi:hypothetical protein